MDKKSFRPRFINILAAIVFCLLLDAPIQAQQINNSEKSLADLYEEFKTAMRLPCGQRDQAIQIGKSIVEKFGSDKVSYQVVDDLNKLIPIIEKKEKQCKSDYELAPLYEEFLKAKKNTCGKRNNAVIIGRKILELHSDNERNQDVIEFVRTQIPRIEEADRICKRNVRYNETYKTSLKSKQWDDFFAVSREIITEEGDSPLALDVMLTFAAVGYRLTANEKNDFYASETVSWAKRALELIESGTKTKSRWGAFENFNSEEKTLGWLNYIIGYISYFRLKENKKAIPYFYKATKYNMEFKSDAFMYQAVAIYYFDQTSSMTSSLSINEFISKANGTGNPFDDETGNLAGENAKKDEIAVLYRQLVNLYNLRYNLAPDENVNGLADYIQKLINRPLLDSSIEDEAKN